MNISDKEVVNEETISCMNNEDSNYIHDDNNNYEMTSSSKNRLLEKINEVCFALYDLNLFLDTHPYSAEALELFKNLAFTANALKKKYQTNFGPLYAQNSSENVPFEWVDEDQPWPWQKEGE